VSRLEQDVRRELRKAVADLLRWAQIEREGTAFVECDPALLRSLMAPPAAPSAPPASAAPPSVPPSTALAAIAARIATCTRCPLHRTRNRTVPGQGHPSPELLFVGEGPGEEEDRQGLAFVGPAGQLLTRLIRRMGLSRDEVFIANIVKCRPTENNAGRRDRPPTEQEMAACIPYLEEQIAVLRPRVIVCLGGTALFGLLGLKSITKHRGRWHEYRGIPIMPTFHPSYLLRAGGDEKARYWEVWEDMAEVLRRLGRPVPDVGPRRPPAAGR